MILYLTGSNRLWWSICHHTNSSASAYQYTTHGDDYLTGSNWLWWSKQTERQQVRSPARGRRLSFNGKIETETERGKYMIQSSDPIIQYSLDIPIFQWDTLWQCHHSYPGSLLLLHYCHYCPYCGHYFKFHQVYYIGLLVSLFSCVKASLVVLVFRFLLMVWIP